MDFHLLTYDHHSNSLQCTAIDQHDQSRWLKSIFEDSSDIEMEDLSKPNCTLKLQKSLWSLKSTQSTIQSKQCPIMALPIVPQLHLCYPLCFPKPALNDIAIAPLIPTYPLFPPHLQPQRPYNWRGYQSSWEGNTLCQGRKHRTGQLLDQLLNGLLRSQVLNLIWPGF